MHVTDEEALSWHLDGASPDEDRRRHLESCLPCSRLMEDTRAFLADIAVAEHDVAPLIHPPPELVRRLSDLEQKLESEEEEAVSLVRTLDAEGLEELAGSWPTVGLACALTDLSYRTVERDPLEGERLASLAVTCALRLRDENYPPDLIASTRGHSFRQQANALRVRGALPEALSALDAAAEWYRKTTVPDPELASLAYIRATVIYTQGQITEAQQLLADAIDVFRLYGDETRLRNAQLLLAALLERAGDNVAAAAVLHTLLRDSPVEDTALRGRILVNLGVCILAREPARAESYLQQARHCLRAAGLTTEVVRAEWHLGRVAMLTGRREEALQRLAAASESASELGLVVDFAMIALDRADLHLQEEEYDEVAQLCRDAHASFQRAGVRPFQAEAFVYLEKAAKSQTLSISQISAVRQYFEAGDDTRPFQPAN